MPSLLDRLKRRKLFRWALGYVAGAWLVVQVVGELSGPFGVSDAVQRGAARPGGATRRRKIHATRRGWARAEADARALEKSIDEAGLGPLFERVRSGGT